mgnify:CR=1 FL=1
MTFVQQDMTSIVIEEKKSLSGWMMEEYGNPFLESYDSFSSSMKISDQDNEHEHERKYEGSEQVKPIEQLSP